MGLFSRWKKRVKPLLTRRVGFSYKDTEVLKDVSMSLKKREVVAIIGASGSGKSTFLKIVAGIITGSHKGYIKVFGKNKFFSRDKIGFVPQEVAFIPDLSLEDNVKLFGQTFGLSEREALRKGRQLMSLLQLNEDLRKMPTQLSGGQKVRLNIVLSLLHDPQIIILDEPFVGLDFQNRRLLWHFVDSMKRKGKSIILTSHLLTETQEHVDRLVILKRGKVLFSGNLSKLKTKLKMNYIFELRFEHLSKESFGMIKKYCSDKEINILDSYGKYMMLGLNTLREKTFFVKYLQKLQLKFSEVGFREPNLDEMFLKT